MQVKTEIRFLTVAVMLFTLSCLAVPHRAAAQTPIDTAATFDHDPMSVVVTGQAYSITHAVPPSGHHRQGQSMHRRPTMRTGSAFLTNTPNYAQVGLPTRIQVNVADAASNPSGKAVHLIFYRGFVREQKFKRKLNYDTNIVNDYSIVAQDPNNLDSLDCDIRSGSATFTVIFHLPAITPHSRNNENDDTEDDPDLPSYKGYRKIYIIATVLKNGVDTKQYCFQTVTVYDYNKVPHTVAAQSRQLKKVRQGSPIRRAGTKSHASKARHHSGASHRG